MGSEGPKDPMAALGEGSRAGEPEVGIAGPGEAEPRFGGEFLKLKSKETWSLWPRSDCIRPVGEQWGLPCGGA